MVHCPVPLSHASAVAVGLPPLLLLPLPILLLCKCIFYLLYLLPVTHPADGGAVKWLKDRCRAHSDCCHSEFPGWRGNSRSFNAAWGVSRLRTSFQVETSCFPGVSRVETLSNIVGEPVCSCRQSAALLLPPHQWPAKPCNQLPGNRAGPLDQQAGLFSCFSSCVVPSIHSCLCFHLGTLTPFTVCNVKLSLTRMTCHSVQCTGVSRGR